MSLKYSKFIWQRNLNPLHKQTIVCLNFEKKSRLFFSPNGLIRVFIRNYFTRCIGTNAYGSEKLIIAYIRMILNRFYHSGKKENVETEFWITPCTDNVTGSSQIYMKRHTDGQGDKQTVIILCGVNLLCKE